MPKSIGITFYRQLKLLALAAVLSLSSLVVKGQTVVSTVNTNTASTGPTSSYTATSPSDAGGSIVANRLYTVNYGQVANLKVTSYVVGGVTYSNFVDPDTVMIQRNDSGRQLIIFYAYDGTVDNTGPDYSVSLDAAQVDNEEALYATGFVNVGYDNLFVNSAGNFANIERMDIIWNSGMVTSSPGSAVFPFFERGGNDRFKVAAILSLDANGLPASYGSLIQIEPSDFSGGTGIPHTSLVLRRQSASSAPIPQTTLGTQQIRGAAVSFTEFGIAANQIVYGVSIFANDVVTPTHTLTDVSTFPTNTASADGGVDVVAGVSSAVASDANLIVAKGPGGYKAALSTWLKANDADDVTTSTDGANVTDWQDHALGDNDATTLVTAPTFQSDDVAGINFNPTVDFVDATERGLQIANNTDFNTATSYAKKGINVVIRTGTDVSVKQQIYEQGSNDKGINIFINSGSIFVGGWNQADGGASWNYNSVSETVDADTEYIISLEFNGNSGKTGTMTAYLNGKTMGSFSSVGLLFNETDGIGLGDINSQSRYGSGDVVAAASFYGSIPELIYCNEPTGFTSTQRNRIESYLALKYGITLDQGSAYNYVDSDGAIIFNTTNAASIGGFKEFNKDIAGIGRDDASELIQLKSKSENANSILTIERASSIGTDATWLIWGRDDGAITEMEDAAEMPSTISKRVTRAWRVAEKNDVGNTSVTFDLTALGLSTANASAYSLLIAGNGTWDAGVDFSAATVKTGGVISGSEITFSDVNLTSGQYITLGTEFFICTPGNVSGGLSLWLKADAETYNTGTTAATNGQTVETWGDKSRNNFDAGNDVNRGPLWVQSSINFNPALNWNAGTNTVGFNLGSNYIFADDADGGLHIFSAVNPIDVGTSNNTRQRKFIYDFGNRNPAGVGLSASTLRGTYYNPGNENNTNINTQDVAVIIEADYDISASDPDAKYLNMNGELERNDSFTFQLDAAAIAENSTHASNQGPVSIGRLSETNGLDSQNGRRFFGDMAEVVVYNKELTAAEEQRVRSYLALKYGVTLSDDNNNNNTSGETLLGSITEGDYVASDGTTIFWNYSDNTTYHNDVAGIGRDDKSCFQQRQSRSVNVDDIVTMGLGEIAADNAANSNDLATDKNFLAWGNDNGSTAFANITTAGTPGTVTERMLRVWKAQETGTVGNTDISFDLTGLTGYSTDATDYQLIIASGGDNPSLEAGSTTVGGTFSGTVLTFSDINLTNGQFFTIGVERSSCGPGGVETSLKLWLRGDLGTSTTVNGANVTSWADQSISGNNAVDAFGAVSNPPSYVTNGTNFNPNIAFTVAGTTFLRVPDATGLNPTNQALFVAGTMGSATQTYAPFVGKTQDYDWQEGWNISRNGTNIVYHKDDSNDGTVVAQTTFPQGDPTLYLAYSDGSNDFININFRDQNSITSNAAAQTSQPILIGATMNAANNNVQAHLDGSIGEIIMFDDDLNLTQRQQVATYLAIKYGITLDQTSATNYLWSDGTTPIWTASTNSDYDEDIAGIGRDDASCFVQKQSKSVNSDAILTIGLGTIAATNAANANSFADNGDYLIWGNDGDLTTFAGRETSNVPSTVSERMKRIWKVQDTGNVGATKLSFDLTGTGFSVADADSYSLLIGSSADMTAAAITTGGTLDGNVLSFTGVDLTNGQFFTIGTANETCGPGGVNTGIALWLAGDKETFSDNGSTAATNGGSVDRWNDQSSPAVNANEANDGGGLVIDPVFQTNQFNFNPSIFIADPSTTNNSYFRTAAHGDAVNGNMTLIAMFETGQSSGNDNDIVNTPSLIGASNASGNDGYGLGIYNGELVFNAANNDAFTARSTSTYKDNQPYIATATRVQAASGAVELYVNSANVNSSTSSDDVALNESTVWAIGNQDGYDNDAQFQGKIGEVLIFNRVITEPERAKVETYLSIKYGITRSVTGLAAAQQDYIAGDGGVVWDYDAQGATYHNDIFGIGRDDLSCFSQQKSKSENSGAIVTIDNNGSFGTNDSWLISGNDGAVLERINNKERPATIQSRLNREWKVQETGTVGTIKLSYDLSTVTGPSGVGTNNLNLTRLMVDDDGDFTNGGTTLIEPSAIDGANDIVTFDVDFTSGQYYSLGSTEVDALPITLIAFGSRVTGDNNVEISWATAQEVNNSFYTIERSQAGINFETIGFKEGAGNSNSIIDYTFIDKAPLQGAAYYRLKQTDFNGEFDYTEVTRVFVDLNKDVDYKVIPNPVNRGENFKVNYPVSEDQAVKLMISSANGGQQLTQTATVTPAENQIEVGTAMLPKGLYIIRIVNKNLKQVTLKFIVK